MMSTNEAIGLASRVIHTAIAEPGKKYWLCVKDRTIIYVPEHEIPSSVHNFFKFNANMVHIGLSSPEWSRLEAKIRELCEGGLL